jgi:hypothetical protein
VPLPGGQSPRRLNTTLIPRGDVRDFAFSSDGERVLYRADALANERVDLFSVPVEPSVRDHGRVRGGDAEPDAVQLTFLDGTRAVQDYRVGAGGTQVFFRVRAAQSGPFGLFRVPVLGGQVPELLSPSAENVVSFEPTPDKARVVFLADGPSVGRQAFSVGIHGGPVTPLDPLPPAASVSVYRITPDARHVVYLADPRGAPELFRVPTDGSTPAEVISGPLPAGGKVLEDFVVLPDGTVVYRADQETDEVFELFAVPPAPCCLEAIAVTVARLRRRSGSDRGPCSPLSSCGARRSRARAPSRCRAVPTSRAGGRP